MGRGIQRKRPQASGLQAEMCIGESLVYGSYFDNEAGKVVAAKGLFTPEKAQPIIKPHTPGSAPLP